MFPRLYHIKLFYQILIDPTVLLTSFLKINLKVCVWGVCMYVHMYVCKSMCVGGRYVHMCAGPHLQMPEKGIRFLEPGVTGGCESPDKGAGN